MVTLKGTGAASEELFCVQVTFQVGGRWAWLCAFGVLHWRRTCIPCWYSIIIKHSFKHSIPLHACKQVVAGALTRQKSSALDALQQSRRLLAV